MNGYYRKSKNLKIKNYKNRNNSTSLDNLDSSINYDREYPSYSFKRDSDESDTSDSDTSSDSDEYSDDNTTTYDKSDREIDKSDLTSYYYLPTTESTSYESSYSSYYYYPHTSTYDGYSDSTIYDDSSYYYPATSTYDGYSDTTIYDGYPGNTSTTYDESGRPSDRTDITDSSYYSSNTSNKSNTITYDDTSSHFVLGSKTPIGKWY